MPPNLAVFLFPLLFFSGIEGLTCGKPGMQYPPPPSCGANCVKPRGNPRLSFLSRSSSDSFHVLCRPGTRFLRPMCEGRNEPSRALRAIPTLFWSSFCVRFPVALHGFIYGPVDETVHAFTVSLCVGLNDFPAPFNDGQIYSVISFRYPLILCFLLCLRCCHALSPPPVEQLARAFFSTIPIVPSTVNITQ